MGFHRSLQLDVALSPVWSLVPVAAIDLIAVEPGTQQRLPSIAFHDISVLYTREFAKGCRVDGISDTLSTYNDGQVFQAAAEFEPLNSRGAASGKGDVPSNSVAWSEALATPPPCYFCSSSDLPL